MTIKMKELVIDRLVHEAGLRAIKDDQVVKLRDGANRSAAHLQEIMSLNARLSADKEALHKRLADANARGSTEDRLYAMLNDLIMAAADYARHVDSAPRGKFARRSELRAVLRETLNKAVALASEEIPF